MYYIEYLCSIAVANGYKPPSLPRTPESPGVVAGNCPAASAYTLEMRFFDWYRPFLYRGPFIICRLGCLGTKILSRPVYF